MHSCDMHIFGESSNTVALFVFEPLMETDVDTARFASRENFFWLFLFRSWPCGLSSTLQNTLWECNTQLLALLTGEDSHHGSCRLVKVLFVFCCFSCICGSLGVLSTCTVLVYFWILQFYFLVCFSIIFSILLYAQLNLSIICCDYYCISFYSWLFTLGLSARWFYARLLALSCSYISNQPQW